MYALILYAFVGLVIIERLVRVETGRPTKILALLMLVIMSLVVASLGEWWNLAIVVSSLVLTVVLTIPVALATRFVRGSGYSDVKRKLAHCLVLLAYATPLMWLIHDNVFPGLYVLLGTPDRHMQADFVPLESLLVFFGALPVFAVTVESLRFYAHAVRLPSLREDEINDLAAWFYTCLSASFVFFAWLDAPRIVLASIAAAVVGDAAACIVGKRLGRLRVGRKSVEGAVAEMIAAALSAWPFIGPIGLLGGLVLALVDLADPPVNDNLYFAPLFALVITPFV